MRRLRSRLRRIGERWTRTRAEKRVLATAVRPLFPYMQPGIWWFPAAFVLLHVGVRRLPAHFGTSKGSRAAGWRAGGPALLRVLVPPLCVWVPRRRTGAERPAGPADLGAASLLFLGPPGGVATFFGRSGAVVTRVALHRPVPVRIIAIRRALQGYLPMPAYEVSDDRFVVREELVDGRAFRDLSTDERAAAYESLLGHYARLVRHEARTARPATLAMAFDALAPLAAHDPAWTRLLARRDESVACAARWPCAPCHGDLAPSNLVVSADGPCLIDFEFADVLPFFYDVVKLALDEASCGRTDLLRGLRPGGRFEQRWHDLWIGAGHSTVPDSLVPVLTAVVVLYARRMQRLWPTSRKRTVLVGAHDVPDLGVVPTL